MSVTANLSGPPSGICSAASTNFTIGLTATLGIDAVFTVGDTVGTDTITTSPVTITAGTLIGTFTITPTTCASRTISISTSTPGVDIGTGSASYLGECACPDNSGTTDSAGFNNSSIACPPALSLVFTHTPTTIAERDIYCTTSPVTMTITT